MNTVSVGDREHSVDSAVIPVESASLPAVRGRATRRQVVAVGPVRRGSTEGVRS